MSVVRPILVPADIVAVRRTSPVPVKKRTPLRQRPEGESIARAGGREWFSDRLFVETQNNHIQAACGTSLTAHLGCILGVIAIWAIQSDQLPIVRGGARLVMPAMISMVSAAELVPPAATLNTPSAPRSIQSPAARAPEVTQDVAAAPVEPPLTIAPETGNESNVAGTEIGVQGGVDGGGASGAIDGTATTGPAAVAVPAPVRVGRDVEPPRKIKDVKPVYPPGAVTDRARGTVIIEATIGTDGKVTAAKVLNSIPQLDQAALDAVRQWEFAPSRLNGVPVAVIITIVVQFAIF